MFVLHPQLQADTLPVTQLALCQVLLMNDSALPWLILVPRRADIRELFQLEAADRATLMEETALAAQTLENLFHPHKLNLGALGNLVAQFHMHVVGRYQDDRAWPGPIWGQGQRIPYTPHGANQRVMLLRQALAGNGP